MLGLAAISDALLHIFKAEVSDLEADSNIR